MKGSYFCFVVSSLRGWSHFFPTHTRQAEGR